MNIHILQIDSRILMEVDGEVLPDIFSGYELKSSSCGEQELLVSNVIPASANPDADADIVKYRKYGLVDVYKNKVAGIYLSHKA